MKRLLKDYIGLFLIAGTIIILDQWTKSLVRSQLAFGQVWSPWHWLTPFARVINWHNTGAAFGMFQSLGGFFTILAFVVSLIILFYYPQVPPKDWLVRLAMGLQLAGAIGNLIDRLHQGYVTDFISLGTFPVFNVADSSISIGVVVMLLGVWIRDAREKASSKQVADMESGIKQEEDSLPEGSARE